MTVIIPSKRRADYTSGPSIEERTAALIERVAVALAALDGTTSKERYLGYARTAVEICRDAR